MEYLLLDLMVGDQVAVIMTTNGIWWIRHAPL